MFDQYDNRAGITRLIALAVGFTLLISCIGVAAGSPGSLGIKGAAAAEDSGNGTETTEITLITGDIVVVNESGSESTVHLANNESATVFETAAGTHVVPQGVNLSKFDRDLFNIDLLMQQNITGSRSVPVIIEWRRTIIKDAPPLNKAVRHPSTSPYRDDQCHGSYRLESKIDRCLSSARSG